jgi:hypothetical protein
MPQSLGSFLLPFFSLFPRQERMKQQKRQRLETTPVAFGFSHCDPFCFSGKTSSRNGGNEEVIDDNLFISSVSG